MLALFVRSDRKALATGTDCTVDYTGLVSCVWDNAHDALCTNNLDRWPFDTRTCTIEYTTGVHNNSQVRREIQNQLIHLLIYHY